MSKQIIVIGQDFTAKGEHIDYTTKPDQGVSPDCIVSHSYNLKINLYIWFGVFWGVPIPLVTLLYKYRILTFSGSDDNPFELLNSPMQWLFLLHPVLFGVIFGILGTVRQENELKLVDTIGQLRDLTVHDPLTGLKNRRYFAHNFQNECTRLHRRNEPLSLLFLDYYKRINDEHGHHIGDVVLKKLGSYLHIQCRPYDTPVRWGGEEFLILLRSTDEWGAILFAERVRAGVALGISQNLPFTFTISIGLAEHQTDDTMEELVNRADQALYHAKQTGRNRVVPWSVLLPEVPHGKISILPHSDWILCSLSFAHLPLKYYFRASTKYSY